MPGIVARMHAIQGAMAIRREREKREQRRMSQIKKSREGGLDGSDLSLNYVEAKAPKTESSSLTAFHLGVVFILLGFLMVFSAMLSGNVKEVEWSRLLGVGATLIIIGLIMVMVNRIITEREEEELTKYVHQRLGRTRSGHALARDPEYGETGNQLLLPAHSMPGRVSRQGSRRMNSSGHNVSVKRKGLVKLKSTTSSGSRTSKASATATNSAQNNHTSNSDTNGKMPLVTVTTEVAAAPHTGLITTKTVETRVTVENEQVTVTSETEKLLTTTADSGSSSGKPVRKSSKRRKVNGDTESKG